MPYVLGYWKLRGLLHPIRFMFKYVGEDFIEETIVFTEDRKNWTSLKHKLGLDFPNLPYLIDGDLRITQSVAIMRYLANKHGLAGRDPKETAVLDMLEQQAYDLLWGLIRLAYDQNFQDKVELYLESLPEKLELFEKYLKGKKYLLGDKLTYVDFYLYEAVDHHKYLKGSCLRAFPNLNAYLKRIEDIPAIKEYQSSKEFITWPLYSPLAVFGGKGDFPMFE